MNAELSTFAARLGQVAPQVAEDRGFNELALELFALQFKFNPAYRKICESRRLTPNVVEHWTQVPFVPTSAFKELELSSIPPEERTAVFHSSGTTEQKPSRHFHCMESLKAYEETLWKQFEENVTGRGQDYDLIVDNLVCLNKVQVKTTNHKEGKHYQVNLVNGSHSDRKNIKPNTEKVYDFLFVMTGADEVFLIPKQAIEHLKTSITLSDKYSKYKIS